MITAKAKQDTPQQKQTNKQANKITKLLCILSKTGSYH